MQLNGYDLTYPRILLLAVAVLTFTAMGIAVGTSSAAFGSFNYEWDGTSELRTIAADSGADVQITRSDTDYQEPDPETTTAMILSPTDSYTESEIETIATFVNNGGTVVVATTDSTDTNQLLAGLGVESRFDGDQLRDEHHYYRSPALPVAPNVHDDQLTQNVSQITLNYGTAVNPSADATVVINSSGFSYLDTNANAQLDDSEPIRQHPVVVQEERGDGRVILVSDASVFINTMVDRSDNKQFAANVVADSETVLFDYLHQDRIPTGVVVVLTATDSPIIQWFVVAGLTALAGVAWVGRDNLRN